MTAIKKAGKQLGRRWAVYLLITIGLLGLLGWGIFYATDGGTEVSPPGAVSHGGPVKDYVSLIDNLRGQGAAVGPKAGANQTFFSGTGYLINVNGQDVQVFEYPDAAAAKKDADKVSSDGSTIGTSMVTWVDTPHFYKKGRLIVLYVGNDAKTLGILNKVLGPQFAGN